MSRIDPGFGYAQARMQSRFGERPSDAEWNHVAATADLGSLLQVLRNSPSARWTSRMGHRPAAHDIEQQLRSEWRRDVQEIADWQPDPWRPAIRWLQWLVFLPALAKLARGGRAPQWARNDPVLGPIVAPAPGDRAGAMRRTGLAPLARAFSPPGDVVAAWTSHWRSLWPAGGAGVGALDGILRDTARLDAQLAALPSSARSDDPLRWYERRLELAFRRNPLSAAATVSYLGLSMLDWRRIRGALATRALREGTVPS